MRISDKAYLDNANHDFAQGVRTAVVEFLRELDSRGVEFKYDFDLADLSYEVESSTGRNLLDEVA